MNNYFKNQFLYYLLFLTPLLFILGIAVVELSILFLTLFFLYKNKNYNYYKDKKFLFLLFFAVYIAINAFFQIHDNLKISSFFFFRYAILSLSIFFILDFLTKNLKANKNKILFIFVFIFLFIFFDSGLQFFSGKNLFGFQILNQRISSVFGSELILGVFLLKMLPLFLYLFFYSNTEIEKNSYVLIFFFSLYFITIYIAGGRTAFFLMLMFIILIIFFIKNLRIIFSISILFLSIFIILTLFFDLGKSNPSNRIFIKTFNQITNNIFSGGKDISLKKVNKIEKDKIIKNIKIFSTDHDGHYTLAYDLFKNNPIFGVGPKGFRYFCRSVDYDPPKGICSTHPHNFLIQILSETGLTGLFFYFYGLFFVIYKLFKVNLKNTSINEKNCFLIISITLIVNFFPFVPNGNFFNNWISITSFYYIGIYLYSHKRIFS